MPFHRTRFLGLAILTILPPVILAQDAPAPRLAEPDDAAQKQAEKTIRDLLKEDYSKRAPADQQALAKKLLRLGDEAKEDAVARYVLLQEAREISAKVGDVETALSAVAETVKRYEVDGIALKAKTLAAMVPGSKSSGAAGALADACLEVIDEAVEEEKFDVARSLVSKAEAAARAARDASRVAEAQRKGREIETLQRESQKAKEAAKILESNPADPDASLVRGRYLLLKGNFEKALPLLSKGADPLLREAADKELAGPSKPEDLTSAADAWWEAAEKEAKGLKAALQERARDLYEKALPELSGLAKARVEKRIEEQTKAATQKLSIPASCILFLDFEGAGHMRREGKDVLLLRDQSEARNHAVLEGGRLDPGPRGQCAVLTGTGVIRMEKPLETGEEWTIAFHVNMEGPWSSAQRSVTTNGPWHHHVLVNAGAAGTLASVAESGVISTSSASLGDLKGWHHVAAVGRGGVTLFYIDGKEAGRTKSQEKGPILLIGNYLSGGYPMINPIDNFTVFRAALPPDVIAALARR